MASLALRHQDLLRDEAFSEVRAFLDDRGISPDDEPAILGAIRERGWELSIRGERGDWSVEIREDQAATQNPAAIVHDADRYRALLRAVRLALSWLLPDEEWSLFDRQTNELLSMSGEEFMRRWETDGLDTNDPRVQHLLLLRPVGR